MGDQVEIGGKNDPATGLACIICDAPGNPLLARGEQFAGEARVTVPDSVCGILGSVGWVTCRVPVSHGITVGVCDTCSRDLAHTVQMRMKGLGDQGALKMLRLIHAIQVKNGTTGID